MRPRNRNSKPPSTPRKLKFNKDNYGYFVVTLCRDSKRYTKRVAHLMLETFVSARPENIQCCHNNGVRSDNRLENLRWDTAKNNQVDRILHGTTNRGERNTNNKLNCWQVRVVRRYYEMYGFGAQTEIAKIFGVVRTTIQSIIVRRTWSWV